MANEKRLIDANELVLEELLVRNPYEYFDEFASGVRKVMNVIRRLPTVDAVEVVHGRWERAEEFEFISGEYVTTGYHCNKCGYYYIKKSNYCPNCGAKMDGDGNGS